MNIIHLLSRRGSLARNGSILFSWMLARAAAQGGLVILMARALGMQSYGQFVTLMAIAAMLAPFAGLGLSHILLRNASRDPRNEQIYLQYAWKVWLFTLPILAVASIPALVWLPASEVLISTFLIAVVSEIAVTSLSEICVRRWQARQRTDVYGVIVAGLPIMKLLVLGILFARNQNASLSLVLWIYAICNILYTGALVASILVDRKVDGGFAAESISLLHGLPFSIAVFATRFQAEFNKPWLAQSSFGFAGEYNISQRIVDLTSLPLIALQDALWPRLYALKNPFLQLCGVGLILLLLGFILGGGLWLAAPHLILLFGAESLEVVGVLRALAWLPLIQVFRALLNFSLVHQGRVNRIGWFYSAGAVVNMIAVVELIPQFGVLGAVVSIYLGEVAMIILFSASIVHQFARKSTIAGC